MQIDSATANQHINIYAIANNRTKIVILYVFFFKLRSNNFLLDHLPFKCFEDFASLTRLSLQDIFREVFFLPN